MQSLEICNFEDIEDKINNISCFTCGAEFSVDTIMLSVFWNGNYYCQDCGKGIIEAWKADHSLPLSMK